MRSSLFTAADSQIAMPLLLLQMLPKNLIISESVSFILIAADPQFATLLTAADSQIAIPFLLLQMLPKKLIISESVAIYFDCCRCADCYAFTLLQTLQRKL